MSTAAMRPFLSALRGVERELSVPIPERVRILRELEYDLEELRDRFLAEGLPPDVAAARALEALVPDPATLRELGRVHTPLYVRLTASMDSGRVRLVERSALVLTAASVLLAETLALLGADLLNDPSPFLWPVIGLGAVLYAVVAGKVFQLWIKGDHGTPARGVQGILAVSGLLLAAGMVGVCVDFYRLAATLERDPQQGAELLVAWLVRTSALLSVAILLALAGALAWFVLTRWLGAVHEARRAVLGLER